MSLTTPDNSYIYIAKCNEYHKIGMAVFPERRIAELQVGNPCKIELIAKYEIPSNRIRYFEGRFHRAFKARNVRGEWFLLSDGGISVVKRQCDVYSNMFK